MSSREEIIIIIHQTAFVCPRANENDSDRHIGYLYVENGNYFELKFNFLLVFEGKLRTSLLSIICYIVGFII